uniref:RCa2 n=1 Tax=Rhizophora mucronata TaxID=61149 RepID=A0A2P2PJV0_RHIMU
MEYATHKNFNN